MQILLAFFIKFKIDIAMFIFWMYNCKCEQILIKEMRS